MYLRRLKKVNDVSLIDIREVRRKPIKPPSWFECWGFILRQGVKTGFQLLLQRAGRSARIDPLRAVQNRAIQRIILAAGLVVFLFALIRTLF